MLNEIKLKKENVIMHLFPKSSLGTDLQVSFAKLRFAYNYVPKREFWNEGRRETGVLERGEKGNGGFGTSRINLIVFK